MGFNDNSDREDGGQATDEGAATDVATIYVCITCRGPDGLCAIRCRARSGGRDRASGGRQRHHGAADSSSRQLLARPERRHAGHGSWTYIFGGLDPACAPALVAGARMLAEAPDGILPWRGRPDVLKRGLCARTPPLDFKEARE